MNVEETKRMQLFYDKKAKVSKVDPCSVCGKLVRHSSFRCTKCQRWVHRRCSDVPRRVSLLSCQDVFVCMMCLGHNCLVKKSRIQKR